ncbi:MAG: hypothetical protein V1913_17780 [Fibrobacterota bacterium]
MDYIILLISKRRLIVVNFAIVFILSLLFSLTLTKYYQSDITFLPPEEQGGINISAILSGEGLSSGDNIMSDYYRLNPQHIQMILESKDLRIKLIDEFDLITSYKLKKSKRKYFDALKVLQKRIAITEEENAGLGFTNIIGFNVSVSDTSAKRAFDMVTFLFVEMQKVVIRISNDKAKRARAFVENRLGENRTKMAEAEKRMVAFQLQNKILDIPQQTEQTIKAYAELRSSIFMKNIQLELDAADYDADSKNISMLRNEIGVMNKKLLELETNPSNDYMLGLKTAPEIAIAFIDIRKDVEINRRIDYLLCQQLEIAKLQEAKSSTTLQVVDPPIIAEYKFKPKRSYIVLSVTLLETIMLIFVIVFQAYFYSTIKTNNDYQRVLSAFRKRPL